MKKTLKVGFDLDGVILYNPIRTLRPFAKKILKPVKTALFHQKREAFYQPKSSFEKFLWRIIHLTSFKINKGYGDLINLAKDKNIKFYLITGRYGFLKSDYEAWLKKIRATEVFEECYINNQSVQPNIFKEKMIKKLKLDVYVEDNWDIIEKLNHHTGAEILWMTNLADRMIPYRNKFNDLTEVCQFLKKFSSRR